MTFGKTWASLLLCGAWLPLAACVLPSVSSAPSMASDTSTASEPAPPEAPTIPLEMPPVAAEADESDSASSESEMAAGDAAVPAEPMEKPDAGQAMPASKESPASSCPPGACEHGKCLELTNNYWCECDLGYMLSGRECVPAAAGPKLQANNDGTVSVVGTRTRWQDPVAAMSFGYEGAIAHCSNLNLGGYSDWVIPTGVSLSRLCAINAANPVFSDSTAAYWINSQQIVTCDAKGIEHTVNGSVARVRCVYAPTD